MSWYFFKNTADNLFLWYTDSLTLSMYYAIPAMLNVGVACLLMACAWGEALPRRTALLVTVVYFSICSMTTASLISATCAGLIVTGLFCSGQWRRFRPLLWLTLGLLLLWMVALGFDACGARYSDFAGKGCSLGDAMAAFRGLFIQSRQDMQLLAAASLLTATGVLLFRAVRQQAAALERRVGIALALSVGSAVLCGVAYMLISTRSALLCGGIHFSSGFFALLLLAMTISLGYLVTIVPCARGVVPLLLIGLGLACTYADKAWRVPPTAEQLPVVRQWLHDVRQAEAAGQTRVEIIVPSTEWPHPKEYFGERLSMVLFHHGITQRRMVITLRAAETASAPCSVKER